MLHKLFILLSLAFLLFSCDSSSYMTHPNGSYLRWQDPPVRVCTTDLQLKSVIKQSAQIWNTKTGTEYFIITNPGSDCQITVAKMQGSTCVGPQNDLLGTFKYRVNKVFPYFESGFIQLCPADYDLMLSTALHEMGHGLGLDHVWWHKSIMTAATTKTQRPEAYDVLLLDKLYPTLKIRHPYP